MKLMIRVRYKPWIIEVTTPCRLLINIGTEQGPECVDGFRLRLRTRTLVRRRKRYGGRENFHFVVRK